VIITDRVMPRVTTRHRRPAKFQFLVQVHPPDSSIAASVGSTDIVVRAVILPEVMTEVKVPLVSLSLAQ
jgi:hypothetical protein